MENERLSYCLLFLALVALANRKHSFHELLLILPVSPEVRRLADSLAP